MIKNVEKSHEIEKKPLELMSLINLQDAKINAHKSILFLYTINEQMKVEIEVVKNKTIYNIIKNMKYFRLI